MKEESFDIHSPYIKSSSNSIDEMRKKIAMIDSEKVGDNFLSFKTDDEKWNTSDGLLRQKVLNISKKIVGEEIRKFAEVASREISKEFENLEKRIDQKLNNNENSSLILEVSNRVGNVEKAFYQEMSNHSENVSSIRESLGRDIDKKIEILVKKLDDLERKIKELEINEFQNLNRKTTASEVESVEEIIVEEVEEEKEEEKNPNLNKEEQLLFINKKMKSLSNLFEKDGVLFKKNTFISKLKSLEAEEFLNFKEGFDDIEENDKEKIENILIDLMENQDIDPKEGESIESFLKRAYAKEYAKMC
ncbi:MAG: hypothetical protein RI945_188 [Candidatus Parcubacteria bacterium]|jgi:hypothetical protein